MPIRRLWVCLAASILMAGCALQSDATLSSAASSRDMRLPPVEHLMLPARGHTVDVSVYRPAMQPIAAVLVSHGAGSSPGRLEPLIDRLRAEGFLVLAPLHRDSLLIPESEREDLRTALGSRIGDLHAVSAYAAATYGGLTLGAVGHSYGSLIALIGGGALEPIFGARPENIAAVATFSSPGLIPGLTEPEGALQTVAVPTLMVTGTEDSVEPFALDPESHIAYFKRMPEGDRTLAIVSGASHGFVYGKEPHYDEAVDLVLSFLRAELIGGSENTRAFEALASDGAIEIRRR